METIVVVTVCYIFSSFVSKELDYLFSHMPFLLRQAVEAHGPDLLPDLFLVFLGLEVQVSN